jgi:hypothetical protein
MSFANPAVTIPRGSPLALRIAARSPQILPKITMRMKGVWQPATNQSWRSVLIERSFDPTNLLAIGASGGAKSGPTGRSYLLDWHDVKREAAIESSW